MYDEFTCRVMFNVKVICSVAVVFMMRDFQLYSSTTVVLMSEIVKLLITIFFLFHTNNSSFSEFKKVSHASLFLFFLVLFFKKFVHKHLIF